MKARFKILIGSTVYCLTWADIFAIVLVGITTLLVLWK